MSLTMDVIYRSNFYIILCPCPSHILTAPRFNQYSASVTYKSIKLREITYCQWVLQHCALLTMKLLFIFLLFFVFAAAMAKKPKVDSKDDGIAHGTVLPGSKIVEYYNGNRKKINHRG